ncbi:MAG: Wadjet anti-phage system protein JetD domain-containing protein [Thiobacillaceae bacterium]
MRTPPYGEARTSPSGVDLHRWTPEERALYNDLRDNRIQVGLRLEQEHIGFHWLAHRLEQLLDGTTASHSGILP